MKTYSLKLNAEQALLLTALIEGDKAERPAGDDAFLNDLHRRLFAFGADGKSLRRTRKV